MQGLTQELRAFIVTNFLFGDESQEFSFSDDDSFIERGIIDSTGILELVAFVQQQYGIPIDDEELVPENLDSIAYLARFIDRKRENVAG
jgi:acyl carrier protein